jgi:pilus assembly protein Flp/PilA
VSNIIKRFVKEESGATMVEYAILVALIAVAVIVTVSVLGQKIDATFQTVVNKMTS